MNFGFVPSSFLYVLMIYRLFPYIIINIINYHMILCLFNTCLIYSERKYFKIITFIYIVSLAKFAKYPYNHNAIYKQNQINSMQNIQENVS